MSENAVSVENIAIESNIGFIEVIAKRLEEMRQSFPIFETFVVNFLFCSKFLQNHCLMVFW